MLAKTLIAIAIVAAPNAFAQDVPQQDGKTVETAPAPTPAPAPGEPAPSPTPDTAPLPPKAG